MLLAYQSFGYGTIFSNSFIPKGRDLSVSNALWEVKSNLHFPGHLYLLIEVHYLMVGGKEIEIVPMVPFLTEPARQLKHC